MKPTKQFNWFIFLLVCFFALSNAFLKANLDNVSDGRWLRLAIEKEGVYSITSSDLQRAGITIPPDKINTIKIYGQNGQIMDMNVGTDLSMNEQPIIVNTNSDGTLSNIIFYGSGPSGLYMSKCFYQNDKFRPLPRHYLNYMDTKNYYLLTFGKTAGKRAAAMPTPEGNNPIKPTSYKATVFQENDKLMTQNPGSGVLWLGNNVTSDIQVDNLPNFNRTGDIEYIFSIAHTNSNEVPLTVSQGKKALANIKMTGATGTYTSALISTFYVKSPATDITGTQSFLKFEYGGMAVYPYHNFYEIHYQSDMRPINNQITLFSDIVTYNNPTELVEYVVSNFTGNIYGFDVTDMSSPKLLNNIAVTGSSFVFRQIENSDIDSIRQYFISGSLQTPASIEEISMLNLRNTDNELYSNADMIVITSEALMESAKKYAEYRQKQSRLKVIVVPLDKIYAEFSYSRLDLSAIRNYIQYAYQNWTHPPEYVFLWGTGHYDYRQIEGYANHVPAYQKQNSNIIEWMYPNTINRKTIEAGVSQYTTDDFFVNVNTADLHQDIAIGRLTISNNEQGNNYINKLDLYENKSNIGNWRRNFLVHADDGPTVANNSGDGNSHVRYAELMFKDTPKDFYMNKVYTVDYPVEFQTGGARIIPKASEELLKQLNLVGNTIYFYSGHGSRNTLTHERTFTIDMLSQLNNADKLFFFGAFACEVGRFDNHIGTLASDIVLLPNSGGIASYSASRVSYADNNTDMAGKLLTQMLKKNDKNEYTSIGEASRLAKRGDSTPEGFMYILIGDPSLTIINPPLNVKLNEVNGIKVEYTTGESKDSTGIDVKGLSQLNLKGAITNDSDDIITDFNGTVNITLSEPKINAIVIDAYNTNFNFVKNGATLSSTIHEVKDGKFETDIMLPGDISFSSDKSIIYMYATDNNAKRFAKGMFDSIIINDIDTTVRPTTAGPTVTIALDSKLFKSGDVVARNPLLMVNIWDTIAINATGLGIGHKIEARIDNSSNVIDLTSNFSPSFTDPNAGDIYQYLYGIEPGYHTITVRAWNVFNNYTETTVGFVIPTDKEEGILSAAFTPNPAEYNEDLGIAIYYTITPPANAEIRIFDATGNEVVNTNQILTGNGYTILDWNTLNPKATLISGTYYYYIKFTYDQTRTTYRSCEKFGSLGIITK